MSPVCIAMVLALAAGSPSPSTLQADEQPEPTASMTIQVEEVRNARGHLRLGVFDSPEGFPTERDAALLWRSLPASEAATLTIQLPPDRYAVVVLHDENGNKKLDRNFLGVPKEGYGVTNNPKPKWRAARFEEAVFTLPAAGTHRIVSIQYF